ncbi:MAG: hypothetical protein IIC93_10410, partial [Chloroflexi bacterium]|nr:hypothetical protein [Chloroflexota bacterium]
MANLIIAIAAFAVLVTGATSFAGSWLSAASSNASAYLTAVEREGETRRTHLAHIASCETPLGTTVRFMFANTGQASLQNFGDWDITVFYQSDGSQLATRLSYTDAAVPSAGEWTVSQILQPNGQVEVIERDVINTGEEARIVIELSSAAWADSFNRLSISTDNGVTLEVGISGDNNCGYYLNNFPTPPSGDTTSQADLPLGVAFPSQPTLYNYDTDSDAQAGRLILKGGTGASESDLTRYQNWRTPALSEDLEIDGTAIVDFWAALKDFSTVLAGDVTVYLRDFDGASYTEIGNVTVSADPWDTGASGAFVSKTAQITGLNYTVAAGNQLEVKVIVGAGSGDDMWFAYDTRSYPSSITITKTLRLLLHSEKAQIAGSTYYTIDDGNHNGGYYLHNNPSPPETTSVSQVDLPATHTYPAATALFNYDTDRDSEAGRLIATGGSGAGETDLAQYQNWLTPVLEEDLTVKGAVQVQLWAAMAGFDTANAGEVTVFLRDLTAGSYTELGNATLLVDPWDSTASGTWVKKLVEIEGVDATVLKGSQLEIKVIVGSGSDAGMLFAYDTTSFPTVVTLWNDTEAYPQGRPIILIADAGSSTGRFSPSPNSGRFIFPLDGYTSLSDSTWTVTYRTKKPRFGWVWFVNAVTYQVTVDNLWEDVDISADVPAGTTGAIIEVVNLHPSNALAGFMKGKEDTNNY